MKLAFFIYCLCFVFISVATQQRSCAQADQYTLYRPAVHQLLNGKQAESFRLLNHIETMNGTSEFSVLLRHRFFQCTDRWKQALQYLETINGSLKTVAVRLEIAQDQRKLGDCGAALKTLTDCIQEITNSERTSIVPFANKENKETPQHLEKRRLLTFLYEKRGAVNEQTGSLRAAINDYSMSYYHTTGRKPFETVFRKPSAKYKKAIEQAIDKLSTWETAPGADKASSMGQKGQFYLTLGEFPKAKTCFEKYLALTPSMSYSANFDLAAVAFHQNRYADCARLMRCAFLEDPMVLPSSKDVYHKLNDSFNTNSARR